jgi:peptidyl-prolyl cis-trans isomerase C
MPKIQITADDMRRYYQRHLDDKFTEHDQAQFRVIKVGIKQTGGREQAKAKAEDLRTRAARGEDFADLAGSFNDDPYLKRTKGDPTGSGGWIDRGAYANTKLEEAVWKLNPEQVTNLVENGDAFYLAKLERRKAGRVRNFDEDAVQQQIRKTLEAEQFNALRSREEDRLRKNAIVFPDPPNYGTALEMAMQKYPEWANGK